MDQWNPVTLSLTRKWTVAAPKAGINCVHFEQAILSEWDLEDGASQADNWRSTRSLRTAARAEFIGFIR